MKMHDFGLWFQEAVSKKWLVTIPKEGGFRIYYDGHDLGEQWSNFDSVIYDDEPYIIVLKSKLPIREGFVHKNAYDRRITLDDFEIVINPNYKGPK